MNATIDTPPSTQPKTKKRRRTSSVGISLPHATLQAAKDEADSADQSLSAWIARVIQERVDTRA